VTHQSGKAALEIAECARAEVVDPEGVAEQIVAVELDQRVRLMKSLKADAATTTNATALGQVPGSVTRQMMTARARGTTPSRPGDGHPEALGLLGEEPGIAHVAVEGRLKVDEHEPIS